MATVVAAIATVAGSSLLLHDSEVTRTVLPNGVRVVVEPMPDAHSVSIGVWVGVGSRDEPAHVAGVSHFLEHLLFKGTTTRSGREIAEMIDSHGGEMNAFTTKENTTFYVRVPAAVWRESLDLLADVVTSPALRDDDVESERNVIVEEMLADMDSPEDRVSTLFAENVFVGHSLGREIAGSLDTVAAITPDAVRAFFAEWYCGANMVVAVAGRVDAAEVVDAVGAHFSGVPTGVAPTRTGPLAATKPLGLFKKKTEQAHILLGTPGLTWADTDRAALALADHILGGGMSSRLFQSIREERGLVYAVFSDWVSYSDAGSFSVYAGTAPSHAREVVDLIHAELDRLVEGGVTEGELSRAKSGFAGSMLLGLEDSGSRMSRIGRSEMIFGRVPPLGEFLARIESIEIDEVQRVAKRVLGVERTLSVVGPFTRKSFSV